MRIVITATVVASLSVAGVMSDAQKGKPPLRPKAPVFAPKGPVKTRATTPTGAHPMIDLPVSDPRIMKLPEAEREALEREKKYLQAYSLARGMPSRRLGVLGMAVNPTPRQAYDAAWEQYRANDMDVARQLALLAEARGTRIFDPAASREAFGAVRSSRSLLARISHREAAAATSVLVLGVADVSPSRRGPLERVTYHLSDGSGSLDTLLYADPNPAARATEGPRAHDTAIERRALPLIRPFREGDVSDFRNNNAWKEADTLLVSAEAGKRLTGLSRMFPEKLVVYDPDLKEAGAELVALASRRVSAEGPSVVLLLPRNETQRVAMGLSWTPQLRSSVWNSASSFVRRAGLTSAVTWKPNGLTVPAAIRDLWPGNDVKAEVLDALKTQSDVLVLFAHGDREGVMLPDGQKLTVREVQGLNLEHRPVVLLLSCEGAKPELSHATLSLQEALKSAGASAVLGFEEKIDAREAVQLAEEFVTTTRRGMSVLDAIRRIRQARRSLESPEMRLKVQIDWELPWFTWSA